MAEIIRMSVQHSDECEHTFHFLLLHEFATIEGNFVVGVAADPPSSFNFKGRFGTVNLAFNKIVERLDPLTDKGA